MIIKELKSFYFINSIKEHKKNKNKLLKLIEKISKTDLDEQAHARVSHSDWFLPREHKREYLDFFYEMINPYMLEMMRALKCKSCWITNGWFQQYSNSDFHNWHVHSGVNYTNVYYLELPNKEEKTQIYNILDNSLIDIDVKEGDVLTFPAYMIHRSKPVTDKRKTVIAFNSDFDDPIQELDVDV
jgi:hypothetical protein